MSDALTHVPQLRLPERRATDCQPTDQGELLDLLDNELCDAVQFAVASVLNDLTSRAVALGIVTDDIGMASFRAAAYLAAIHSLQAGDTTFRWLAKNEGVELSEMEMHRCLRCGASSAVHTIGPRPSAALVTELYSREEGSSKWELVDDGMPHAEPPGPRRPTLRRVK